MSHNHDVKAVRSSRPKKDLLILFIIGFLGLTLSFFFYRSEMKSETALMSAKFEAAAGRGFSKFKDVVIDIERDIEALKNFIYISGEISRDDFKILTKRVLNDTPSLQALEWIPRIKHDDLTEFVDRARKDGFANFRISQKDSQDMLVQRPEQAEYFPVYYMEPLAGNEQALGFDMVSEPLRRRAIVAARDSGKLVSTEHVRLVQEKDQQSGFIVVLPVYARHASTNTIEDRGKNLTGFVLGVFRTGDFFFKSFESLLSKGLDVRVYERQSPDSQILLYTNSHDVESSSNGLGTNTNSPPALLQERKFDLWGRSLDIVVTPDFGNPAWRSNSRSALIILIGMLSFTCLTVGYVAFLQKDKAVSKRTATERAEILQRLDLALKGADLGVWDWQVQTGRLFQDEVWHSQLGYTMDDTDRNITSWENRIHPDDKEAVLKALKDCLEGRDDFYSVEHRLLTKSGDWKWILTRGKVIESDDKGLPMRMLGTHMDIDEWKRAELGLLESNERFELLTKTIQDAFWISAPHMQEIQYMSPGYEKIWGQPTQLIYDNPETFLDIVHPSDVERVKELLHESHVSGAGHSIEYRIIRQDGSVRWILDRGYPVHGEDGKLKFMCGTSTDITDLKKAQEERNELATAIEQSAERVIITDLDGKITYVNPAFEVSTGHRLDEVIGQTPAILKSGHHEKAFYEDMWNTILEGKTWNGQFVNKKKDGSLIYEQSTISPIRDASGKLTSFVQIARDITEEENLRRQLTQSQKMEAVGTLAGGIAHDFNNIIHAIMGYTELVMEDVAQESRAYRNLSHVLGAAGRSGEMVKQILTFSRQADQEVSSIDIGPLVKEGMKFLRASIPPNIDVAASIETNLGHIMADPTQIHQVLMNLCVNASQAIGGDKGKILVELERCNIDEAFAASHPPLQPGNHLRLRISDTGSGIPLSVKNKIFDPYFTTKEAGHGTGLGLSVVHGIVTSFHGSITVDSEEGAGTSFTILFPVIEEKASESVQTEDALDAERLSGRILLVDDEEIITEMMGSQLERLGLAVTATTDPDEASRLFSQDPHQFDLVITDLMMPGMSGTELSEIIRAVNKDVPIIISTGWSEKVPTETLKQLGISAVVNKPLSRDRMVKVIKEALKDLRGD